MTVPDDCPDNCAFVCFSHCVHANNIIVVHVRFETDSEESRGHVCFVSKLYMLVSPLYEP